MTDGRDLTNILTGGPANGSTTGQKCTLDYEHIRQSMGRVTDPDPNASIANTLAHEMWHAITGKVDANVPEGTSQLAIERPTTTEEQQRKIGQFAGQASAIKKALGIK